MYRTDSTHFASWLLLIGALTPALAAGAPLVDAVESWDLAEVERLLEAGADPNVIDRHSRNTPLLRAARNDLDEIARLLLAHGAQVDFKADEDGLTTALHVAASAGASAVIESLLEAGADIRALDGIRWTPLMHAVAGGRAAVVQRLIDAGSPLDSRDVNGDGLLAIADMFGQDQLKDMLRQAGAR
ncbi:MAG TPA: ankyrin repeat domain-containing protein [Xanthomonadaceae bacterium]|nr:ankyrin repeat domain-containing protein [Xanthomonadaceae bacterium]